MQHKVRTKPMKNLYIILKIYQYPNLYPCPNILYINCYYTMPNIFRTVMLISVVWEDHDSLVILTEYTDKSIIYTRSLFSLSIASKMDSIQSVTYFLFSPVLVQNGISLQRQRPTCQRTNPW